MRSHVLLACLAVLALAAAPDFPDPASLPATPVLPDPLVLLDGRKVSTRDDWFARRRPELRALFAHYMYGQPPISPLEISGKVEREDKEALGGKATLREVTITYGPKSAPPIHLLLLIPNPKAKPESNEEKPQAAKVPAFVGLNFHGNHAALADPKIALPEVWVPERSPGAKDNRATDAGRGTQVDTWNAEEVIGRGYALATAYCGDIAPDHPGHADGVHPAYPGYDWGTVAAWAWGLSRIADYLMTVPEIDRRQLAVVGHSRLGKAALVAGAHDDRFALVIPHQAGCGGTSPSRGTVGESVTRINTSFPHWFNSRFKQFNDRPECLPFDQHCLAAMVAPRPLLYTNAVEDTWANPEGQFQMLKAAEPVYRLLDAGGLDATSMPDPGQLVSSVLGFAIRPGKHSMTPEDWKFFLAFADRHFGRKPATP